MTTEVIPKTYKAVIYSNPGTFETQVVDKETPEPGQGQVLIHLTHSGVCHSDLGICSNSWAHMPAPTPKGQVGGHEGCGRVVKLGLGVTNLKVGDRVGIKYIASACLDCENCLLGNDFGCPQIAVSGYFVPGTFQQYVCSNAAYVTPIPDGIDSAEAAPFLCAGITVYNALRRSKLQAGEYVVISGAGGGLGHFATQYAKAFGLRVIAIDAGSKRDFAIAGGSEIFIDFTKYDTQDLVEQVKKVTGGVGAHGVIVVNANNASYDQSVDFLRVGGTVVCVGIPEGQAQPIGGALAWKLITGQLTITGAAVGNRTDAIRSLDFAARGLVKTSYQLEPMSKLTEIFQKMHDGKLQGRVVLDLSKV